MTYAAALAKTAKAVGINASSTSYFSAPSDSLDPRLFDETGSFRVDVRDHILELLFGYLAPRFEHPESWATAWIAGSGVSYQWMAARMPGDLDCLVGIQYPAFRRSNPDYAGLSNEEIADMFNDGFVHELTPGTAQFLGAFELTFYVNPQSNITDINPYAAYNLSDDEWTVEPQPGQTAPHLRSWDVGVQRDYDQALTIIDRYSEALSAVRGATNPAHRTSAEARLRYAVDMAADLYENIHAGRKAAFSRVGAGYEDWHNYRWQAGKANGSVTALRQLKDYRDEAMHAEQAETYGMQLPDARTLIRRSATRRANN